jgi:ribonucleoside-diphosphate reductase beta chain
MSEIERKQVFNEQGERGTQRIINGNSTNLREWNRVKYQWAHKLWGTMVDNFWQAKEVSLGADKTQFMTLTPAERRAFDKTISFLNFLDSIQVENLPNLAAYVTAPEVSDCLTVQAFQESIHAQSYSVILDSVCDPATKDSIYDEWRNDAHLLKRNQFIASLYQAFVDEQSDVNFVKAVMANYLLESLYFYSGFAFFHSLARQGKMTGTDTMIKYIQKDEFGHVALFRNMIQELRVENPLIFTPAFDEELRDMVRTAVDQEIEWGHYIMNNQILGMSNEVITRYIKYLGNERSGWIGLGILYPESTEHPMKWIESFEDTNKIKTDFFEQKVTTYSKALTFDDLDDL